MQAYAFGRRSSGMMEPIAVGLSKESTAELARYYASLESKKGREASIREPNPEPVSTAEAAQIEKLKLSQAQKNAPAVIEMSRQSSASAIERGREIATRGIPAQRVPACAECHGPSDLRRNPNYPILAGQYAEYLLLQLTLFKEQVRGGTAYAHLMRPVAAGLHPQQMRDVAEYYESLQQQQ
jgi:cytochrome c553